MTLFKNERDAKMKCLVFSDSHGSYYNMRRALLIHSDAEVVFFLGDGLSDAEMLASEFPDKAWIAVRGNCDTQSFFRGAEVKKTESINLSGFRIILTHGDLFSVKYTTGAICALAKRENADVVLFGHTHMPYEEYVPGEHPFYLFNPGSASLSGGASYGILMLDTVPFLSHGAFL